MIKDEQSYRNKKPDNMKVECGSSLDSLILSVLHESAKQNYKNQSERFKQMVDHDNKYLALFMQAMDKNVNFYKMQHAN
jgi:hypothetical protein